MSDEYVVLGYEAYYILVNGQEVRERVNAGSLHEAAKYIRQEIGGENRLNVRMITVSTEEIILLPVQHVAKCIVRPIYKMEADELGGTRYVKKPTDGDPAS